MTPPHDTATRRGHVVNANGVNIYYETHGQGTPLLLLHAGTLTADSWQPYLAGFAKHYQAITPDSRAHGRSDDPPGAISYKLLAEDMAALARALDLHQRGALSGHGLLGHPLEAARAGVLEVDLVQGTQQLPLALEELLAGIGRHGQEASAPPAGS